MICISNHLPKLSTNSSGELRILIPLVAMIVLESWEMNHWEFLFKCPFRQLASLTLLPDWLKELRIRFSSEPELSLLTWPQSWGELILHCRLRRSRKEGKKYPAPASTIIRLDTQLLKKRSIVYLSHTSSRLLLPSP